MGPKRAPAPREVTWAAESQRSCRYDASSIAKKASQYFWTLTVESQYCRMSWCHSAFEIALGTLHRSTTRERDRQRAPNHRSTSTPSQHRHRRRLCPCHHIEQFHSSATSCATSSRLTLPLPYLPPWPYSKQQSCTNCLLFIEAGERLA